MSCRTIILSLGLLVISGGLAVAAPTKQLTAPTKQLTLTKTTFNVKPARAKNSEVKRIHHPLLLRVKRAKLTQKVKLQPKQFDLSGALKAPR